MKKRAARGVAALLAAGLALQLAACSAEVKEPVYEDNQQIAIGAWIAPPPGYINNETYKQVAESGINIIYGLYEDIDQNALDALKYAEQNGIQYMARSRSLFSIPEDELDLMEGMFDEVAKSPALHGIMVVDEPGAGKYEHLGILNKKFKELYPDLMFYVNLNPIYSSPDQRDGRTYQEYIDEYIEVVNTDYMSYDHYPLKNSPTSGTFLTENYLLNLDIVSTATKKAGIPFWLFIQSMGYWVAGSENRVPDEADIRWQVYNSLAFGARGLQHFTYWTPLKDDVTVFSEAMVDKEGNKTPIYDAVKNVNHEILAFDHIYLNYDNVGVMTFPEENAPPELYIQNRLPSFAPIKRVESEHPVVVGAFEDKDGNQAIMLVNFTDPAHGLSNEVNIKFNKVKEVSEYGKGGNNRAKVKGGNYNITLEPGEGKFILLLK